MPVDTRPMPKELSNLSAGTPHRTPEGTANNASKRGGAPSRPRSDRPPQKLYLCDPRRVSSGAHATDAIVVADIANTTHVPPLPAAAVSLAAAAHFYIRAGDRGKQGGDASCTALAELCPTFADDGSCPRGSECGRVHAVRFTVLSPHLRHRTETPVYPASLGTFAVALPNETTPSLHVDALHCFVSKAVDTAGVFGAPQRPLGLCAHFAMKGLCLFGAACCFIHHAPPQTTDVDAAQDVAVSSSGSILGRTSEGVAPQQQQHVFMNHNHVQHPWRSPAAAAAAAVRSSSLTFAVNHSGSTCTVPTNAGASHLPPVAALAWQTSFDTSTAARPFGTAGPQLTHTPRFRHDPYGRVPGWQAV